MSLRQRIRTLFRLFFLFTVLVSVALVSAITTIRFTIQGNQETLPNLAGKNVEQAERLASGIGLELKVEDKVFSSVYAANDVISQAPPAGTRVKAGQHVHVMVSLGSPRIVVPDLAGSSSRVAQILAVQKGLTVGDVAMVHWDSGSPDQVVSQDPLPSSTVMRTPAVNFLISLGPEPPAYVCPNFTGIPIDQAERLITQAGFQVSSVKPSPDAALAAGHTPGTILAQTPEAGSRITTGDTLGFQVAP